MSNKVSAFIVVIKDDISEESAERLSNALLWFQDVISVKPYNAGEDLIAEITTRSRTNLEWTNKLFDIIKAIK